MDFPEHLRRELKFLKNSFSQLNNGYPPYVIDQWFVSFKEELARRPEMLVIKSRLSSEQVFLPNGQQIFQWPTALQRFPMQNSSLVEESEDRTENGGLLGLDDLVDGVAGEGTNGFKQLVVDGESHEEITLEKTKSKDQGMDSGSAKSMDQLLQGDGVTLQLRQPTLIVPYMNGVSDRLRMIAKKYDVRTWYTFPGKTMDAFTVHRGRLHESKARNTVYCAQCICGVEYIGESNRNLKVRLGEHKNRSSASAFSCHLCSKSKQGEEQETHAMSLHNTTVLAMERNSFKCKILESLFINNKKARICNSGPSIDLVAIWRLCDVCIARQLAKKTD